ncbi:GNAT family N-acetyltransferase [Limibacter armeniacum]|uniref:GNAT family N-acetyltransferase n=1 Tax=Limibacter armeniacum TaxID=466084 RepID=UPI002FE51AF7
MKILETKRLYLREMTPDDAEDIYRLNLDWDHIKYTGDKPFESIQEAKRFLENYSHYRTYGFGRWAVIEKDSDKFLGWCGLKYTPELEEYDIGFRFFKEYWNKGIGSEAAKACLDYGFSKFGLTRIVGRAMKDNLGSIRVLEKIGLEYLGEYDFDGEAGVIYEIKKLNKGKV